MKNKFKVLAGIFIIFGLITCGVSASDEGRAAYRSNDYGTATYKAGK